MFTLEVSCSYYMKKGTLKQTFDSFKTINKSCNGNINNKNDNDTNINNLSDKIAHNRILLDTV